MSSDHADRRCQQIAEAQAAYNVVEVGDLINIVSWFGDIWAEVKSTYCDRDGYFQAGVTYYDPKEHTGWNMTSMDRIRKVHKAGTPWDHQEVRLVYTKDGAFGDRQDKRLPDAFLYQATFKLEAWLWNYCGKNCAPKKEKRLEDFAAKIDAQLTALPWNVADDVIRLLLCVNIKGWHPVCRKVAETKYSNAIWPNGK